MVIYCVVRVILIHGSFIYSTVNMAIFSIKRIVFISFLTVFFAIKNSFAALGDDEFLQARAAYDKKISLPCLIMFNNCKASIIF